LCGLGAQSVSWKVGSSVIPLLRAKLCLDCEHVVESATDVCPKCAGRALLDLARILSPNPELGGVAYVLTPPRRRRFFETVSLDKL
jgi:hypothetical protein